MTGRTSSTIHSGFELETRNPSTTFMRLAIFLRFCLERVFSICSSSSLRRRMMNGSKRRSAISFGMPHCGNLRSGPTQITERPE